jgi:hypothetical protein
MLAQRSRWPRASTIRVIFLTHSPVHRNDARRLLHDLPGG